MCVRRTRTVTALLLAFACLAIPGVASAAKGTGTGGGSSADAEVVDRYLNISAQAWNGRYNYGNSTRAPCSWTRVGVDLAREFISIPGDQVEREVNGVTERLWWRDCEGPGSFVWVPEISTNDLLGVLIQDLRQRRLPDPQLTFGNVDPDFGWAYARVPVDVRAMGISPVTVTVSVAAGPFFAWATMRADPVRITFDSGDPESGTLYCTPGGLAAGIGDEPGSCSFEYVNSSAVAMNGRTFDTELVVEWDITYQSSGGAGSFEPVVTRASAPLAVAEVQSLVVCGPTGSGQGGC